MHTFRDTFFLSRCLLALILTFHLLHAAEWRRVSLWNLTPLAVLRCSDSRLPSSDALNMSGSWIPFRVPFTPIHHGILSSSLISTHNITRLLDEEMKPEEVDDLAQAEEVCRRFMEWDLSDATGLDTVEAVKAKLAEVLGKIEEWAEDGKRDEIEEVAQGL